MPPPLPLDESLQDLQHYLRPKRRLKAKKLRGGRKQVLITGFGPFGIHKVNPSWEVTSLRRQTRAAPFPVTRSMAGCTHLGWHKSKKRMGGMQFTAAMPNSQQTPSTTNVCNLMRIIEKTR